MFTTHYFHTERYGQTKLELYQTDTNTFFFNYWTGRLLRNLLEPFGA